MIVSPATTIELGHTAPVKDLVIPTVGNDSYTM